MGVTPASSRAGRGGCTGAEKAEMRCKMRENKSMESAPPAGREPAKKHKLSSDENSNPDLSGDDNVSIHPRVGLCLGWGTLSTEHPVR